MEIRSFRRVFDLERRIYSVDRLRLNPAGIPLRGVVYFLALTALSLTAADTPAVGVLARVLPWYARDVALPAAGATLLSFVRVEGRVFHLAAWSLLRYRLGPRTLAGGRGCAAASRPWWPRELLLLPDGSDSRMRRLRYTGPGAVLVCVQHERNGRARERGISGLARSGRRPVLSLRQPAGARALERAVVVSLAEGARLRVRSSQDRSV